MRNNPISLASGVLPEFAPPITIAAAVAAGYDAVGLWAEPSAWTAETTRAARQALGGLPVLDIEVIWLKPGPDNPDHFRILDIGMELGARHALTVSSDPDPGATAAKLARLCEHAEPSGLRVALEFGLFTEVKTLADALSILSLAGKDNAALLIDPLHLSRSSGSPDDIKSVPRRLLPYAQFCDAPVAWPDLSDPKAVIEEAVDLRLLPGKGALPLKPLLDALPPDIPLSVELRSKALREAFPDATARAKKLAQATRAFLQT
jgi:sugar phosphate isomerase/epimerase